MNLLAPERVEAIFACLDAGQSERAAAKVTGATRRTIARYRALWRRAHLDPADAPDEGTLVAARMEPGIASRLAADAAKRALSRPQLVGMLLEAIVADDLVPILLGEDRRVRKLAEQLGSLAS